MTLPVRTAYPWKILHLKLHLPSCLIPDIRNAKVKLNVFIAISENSETETGFML